MSVELIHGEALSDKSPNHAELLRAIVESGDRSAFRILFEHFGPRIKSMFLRQGLDASAADDLVQDTMLKIWQKSGQFDHDRGNVNSWVFTIARNLRIDKFRSGSARIYEDIFEVDLPDEKDGAEKQLNDEQTRIAISKILSELPHEQRKIIELSFFAEVPQTQIAEELNLPLGTVKSRTRLAFGKLKAKLEQYK